MLKNSTQHIDKMTYTLGEMTSRFGRKVLGWFDSWAEQLDTSVIYDDLLLVYQKFFQLVQSF